MLQIVYLLSNLEKDNNKDWLSSRCTVISEGRSSRTLGDCNFEDVVNVE